MPARRELAMALVQEKSDRITRRDPNAIEAAVAVLAAKFGNRLVTSRAVREQHANTTSWIANEPPDAVVFPQATEDVQDIVRICARLRVPVIPFGTGTSLEGHVNAPYGGVSIDFRDMNRVLAVNSQDLDCVVEPGITRKQLNEHLRDQGLFFPIDPGADASLGGMAATRCSGTNAVRYGTMQDNVLALKVVLANGELMTTGRRPKKSSAGHDPTRLIVRSDGTLGVITALTLKLSGIPEAIYGGVRPSPSVEAARNATIAPIIGTVGDGNFHLALLVDMTEPTEGQAAKRLCERLVERALAMDGASTGEHGIGQGKMKYLAGELGRPALAAMAAIKRALDPEDIMNPGKIVAI